MIASSLIVDPFEVEQTLAPEPRLLSFSPRALEARGEELVRALAFDLCGAIPRPIGETSEALLGAAGPERVRSAFFQVGQRSLAIVTELERPAISFRVLELLGTGCDTRVRMNLVHVRDLAHAQLSRGAADAAASGRPIGQVRLWTPDPAQAVELRRVLGRQLAGAGLDPLPLDATAREPMYLPAAGERIVLDPLPPSDTKVAGELLGLLAALPVEGLPVRSPRRVGAHTERVRREGAIVSWSFETHRGGTGVVHVRRREVEAGVERPGLVRTFNVAGLRGGARVRLRDVGGRCAAEVAGAPESVTAIHEALARAFGGRT